MPHNPDDTFAALLYNHYCVNVGCTAMNGDPLPAWDAFAADESKAPQVNAWRATAALAETAVLQAISIEVTNRLKLVKDYE